MKYRVVRECYVGSKSESLIMALQLGTEMPRFAVDCGLLNKAQLSSCFLLSQVKKASSLTVPYGLVSMALPLLLRL